MRRAVAIASLAALCSACEVSFFATAFCGTDSDCAADHVCVERTCQRLELSNVSPPGILGDARDGEILTATHGEWAGPPVRSFAYQWQRCEPWGGSCFELSGAASSSYTLTPGEVGMRLRVAVTASSETQSLAVSSEPSAVVAAIGPSNEAVPTIAGRPMDGELLTATPGTWRGTPQLSVSYQWQRCDVAGEACAYLVGAIGPTYTPGLAEIGSTLRVTVTARNVVDAASATSEPTAEITGSPPVNRALPTITGAAVDGQVLTCDTGTWEGAPTISFSYQWQRCDSLGAGCADLAGATGTSFLLSVDDVARTLRVRVTATSSWGSADVVSAPTAQVAATAPVNLTLPTIAGLALDGETLTAASGTWSGTPVISYAYSWQRCDALGGGCSTVAAGVASYLIGSSDIGNTLRVSVIGSNAGGASAALSEPTPIVAGRPPVNLDAPVVSGSPVQGQTLMATPGTWSGTAPLAFSYQWQRCDSLGADCADLSGATGTSFLLSLDDIAQDRRQPPEARGSPLTNRFRIASWCPTGMSSTRAPL
ncbi:MAG: hypothetical protein HY901_13460 [Deltaproteobacteria bacterium]|nr:hypothetical protein [Deltaproteobacteria bacterium]